MESDDEKGNEEKKQKRDEEEPHQEGGAVANPPDDNGGDGDGGIDGDDPNQEISRLLKCHRRGCHELPCAEHPKLCAAHFKDKCSVTDCIKQGYKRGMCRKHAYGDHQCSVEGCINKPGGGTSKCAWHKYGECKFDRCKNIAASCGWCIKHKEGNKIDELKEENAALKHEIVARLARDRGLRARHLVPILERQGGVCADPLARCPWVQPMVSTEHVLPLPLDAAELDHITPLSEGGSDDPDNLQVLCACCHSMKTHAERSERA